MNMNVSLLLLYSCSIPCVSTDPAPADGLFTLNVSWEDDERSKLSRARVTSHSIEDLSIPVIDLDE